MDTIEDCARDAAKELYGLSEAGMFAWLRFSQKSDLPSWFLDTCIAMDDRKILDPLIERYWDEYVDNQVYANKANAEQFRSNHGD